MPTRNTHPPAFTRRNVYLRDSFTCQVRPQHPWAGVLAGRLTLTLNRTPDSEPNPNPNPNPNQYCNKPFPTKVLTYDHVVPVSKGGRNTWDNVVTCCTYCNSKKGDRLLKDLKGEMKLKTAPYMPSRFELHQKARI